MGARESLCARTRRNPAASPFLSLLPLPRSHPRSPPISPIMNKFVDRFSTSNAMAEIRRAKEILEEEDDGSEVMWGSQAGFGALARGVPRFAVPDVPDVRTDCGNLADLLFMPLDIQPSAFLRLHTDDHADPSCRIKIKHGTTTLAFRFQGGVIVAVDSRATAGSYIGMCSLSRFRRCV